MSGVCLAHKNSAGSVPSWWQLYSFVILHHKQQANRIWRLLLKGSLTLSHSQTLKYLFSCACTTLVTFSLAIIDYSLHIHLHHFLTPSSVLSIKCQKVLKMAAFIACFIWQTVKFWTLMFSVWEQGWISKWAHLTSKTKWRFDFSSLKKEKLINNYKLPNLCSTIINASFSSKPI